MTATAIPPAETLQTAFLSILPRIELHALISFRHVRCPHQRQELVEETSALAWRWFARLVERGKDPLAFPSALARYAVQAVRSGRRACGQENSKDVMSQLAQQRHSLHVEPLPSSLRSPHEDRYSSVAGQRQQEAFEERLKDNMQTPVPEQVAFRIDFPAWLCTLSERERHIVKEMAQNERTLELSARFHLSPGRISQLRRELHEDWLRFCS